MVAREITEGLILGLLLILICAIAKRKGAVEMVHLYHKEVQERCVALLRQITPEKVKRNRIFWKAVCIPSYLLYVLVCVYVINGSRSFADAFWQLFVILSVMNLIDRFAVDEWWVGHTSAWIIPGTEDLKPYITFRDKCVKWTFGTVGMALISAILAGIMTRFL